MHSGLALIAEKMTFPCEYHRASNGSHQLISPCGRFCACRLAVGRGFYIPACQHGGRNGNRREFSLAGGWLAHYAQAMKIPRIPIALQQALMRSLREKLHHARLILQRCYPEPTVLYCQRGTMAASAWPESNQIRLNPVLLLENQQQFIDQVIPHELAHLLVWHHFGQVRPHGKEWKWMMETVLNAPALRTHQFALCSLDRQLFHYQCNCQLHWLTLRRHNKVLRGAEYRCLHCGASLRFTDVKINEK